MRRAGTLLIAIPASLAFQTLSIAACTSPVPPETTPTPTPSETSPAATATPTPSATQPVQAPVIEIAVDPSGMLTMPATLQAGGYVFRVTSAQTAVVTVIEPQGGYAPDDLASDFGPPTSGQDQAAAWASFDQQARSLGGTWSEPATPAEFALTLGEGSYWFVDLGREPGAAGSDDVLDPASVVTVTVTGPMVQTSLPEPDGVATANADRSWTVPPTLPAQGTLLVSNPTQESHQLVFDRVPADSSAQEWLALTRSGRGMDCACNSPARASAGTELLWIYDLPPGDYLVIDFSPGEYGYPQYNGAGASIVTLS